jgi:hypothetical protein
MESPLIANGTEISRIDGFVKIEKKKRTKSLGASVKYQYFCRIVSNEAEAVLLYFASLMKMRLAGLRFVIRGHLHIHIVPGMESRCHSFYLCFAGLDLNDAPQN